MSATTSVLKFRTGRLLATPAALEAIQRAGQEPLFFLERHVRGDWGEVNQEDWKLNDEALRDGTRLLSSYPRSRARVYGSSRRRSATTASGPPRRSCCPRNTVQEEVGAVGRCHRAVHVYPLHPRIRRAEVIAVQLTWHLLAI
jgi:hypothetical protein